MNRKAPLRWQASRNPPQRPAVTRQTISAETVVRDTPVAIVVSDMHGEITMANPAAKKMAQIEPEGKRLKLAPEIWGDMSDAGSQTVSPGEWPCNRALRGETTISKQYQLVQHVRIYDVLFSAAPILSACNRIAGSITTMVDITQPKQAELALRQEAVRTERSRMAADIHDTLAQSLTAIVLQLRAAEDEFPKNKGGATQHLRRAQAIARESLAEARQSLWTLVDESLGDQNLGSALSDVAQRLYGTTAIAFEMFVHGQARALRPNVVIELFRIGKEALWNALKHSQATSVRIDLCYWDEEVRLSVSDNGRGFAPSQDSPGSFGLNVMQNRAQRIGGRVFLCGGEGKGTQVLAIVLRPYGVNRQWIAAT